MTPTQVAEWVETFGAVASRDVRGSVPFISCPPRRDVTTCPPGYRPGTCAGCGEVLYLDFLAQNVADNLTEFGIPFDVVCLDRCHDRWTAKMNAAPAVAGVIVIEDLTERTADAVA